MAVQGAARLFTDKWKFLVEIDGVVSAGFQKCSELSGSTAVIEHYEGGAIIPDKSPGRGKFDDITLERGAVIGDLDLYDWFSSVLDAVAGIGGATPGDYKRDMDIVQQDRSGLELMRWRVSQAWPNKFKAGDWDNDSDEKVIESVVLSIDYFYPVL